MYISETFLNLPLWIDLLVNHPVKCLQQFIHTKLQHVVEILAVIVQCTAVIFNVHVKALCIVVAFFGKSTQRLEI